MVRSLRKLVANVVREVCCIDDGSMTMNLSLGNIQHDQRQSECDESEKSFILIEQTSE